MYILRGAELLFAFDYMNDFMVSVFSLGSCDSGIGLF